MSVRLSIIYRSFILSFMFISLFMMGGLKMAYPKDPSSTEGKIIEFVKAFYAPDEVEVRLESHPEILNSKAKIEAINFAKVPDTDGAGLCLIDMVDQRGRPRGIYVPIKVLKKRPLFVAKRELLRGEVLKEEDIKTNYTYLTGRASIYPSSIDYLIGKTLKRDIKRGTTITEDAIEDPVMVRRGKMVILIGENKRLLIKTQGKALENGRLGDVIKVKNTTSGKVVHATVTAENTVTVGL